MKKLIILCLVLLCSLVYSANAQCKYAKKIPKSVAKVAAECNVTLQSATRVKPMFQKYRTAAGFIMAKSNDAYFMYFTFMRNNSSRFDILKDNSLDLFLSNGNKIQLYPCADYSGQYQGLSFNYIILCMYSISKQQMDDLIKNDVIMASIHYTSEKELEGSQVDKEGRFSLDYEVASEKFRANPGILSQCILYK